MNLSRSCPHASSLRALQASRLAAAASAACLSLGAVSALAADPAGGTFELGAVVVTGKKANDSDLAVGSTLQQEDLIRANSSTVSSAVSMLPGASLSRNSRNEEMVYLRGFDARRVPLFVDGIPLYVPYDGYVDFARFTTFDLAEIHVAAAGASLLYGPNTLGGAINLITRKPTTPLEGDVRMGFASGSEKKMVLNIGTRQERWYAQLGLSALEADTFPLPSGFRDFKAKPTDTGKHRENADRSDQRLSLKVGLVPNATDEYAIGYVRQEGEKGNPVYTGQSTNGIRYWRWPYWDKDSLYLISSTRLGQNSTLKARVFHDTYKNRLDAFTDARYATPQLNTNFPSVYNDSSTGLSLALANYALDQHELRLALHVKEDKHQDSNPMSPNKNYRDITTSLAAEDTITLSPDWRLRLGLSHDRRDAREVYQWPTGSTSATNGVAELARKLDDQGGEAYAVLSRKTRFPTIKDRYSARMGAALPNPDLRPEEASHVEFGLKGAPWDGASGRAAVFYSRITNLMQNVYIPAPVGTCGTGSSTCAQMQNVARARHAGLEVALEQRLARQWNLAAAYTYLARRNLSDASVELTDTPRHRLFATLRWMPNDAWEVRTTLEAEQGRKVAFSGSGRSAFRELAGYGTVGVKAVWKPRKDMSLDFGVSNLGDKWYELADGLPMPGRTWFVNGIYRF